MAELDPTKPTASRARIESIVRRARGSLPAALLRRFIDAELLSQSAALALYAILSLAPLLLILVWLTSAILPGARESLTQQIAQLGGTDAEQVALAREPLVRAVALGLLAHQERVQRPAGHEAGH